ncbi:hypothetical protein GBF38_019600, partial [Nibea albiflora]
SLKPVDKRLMSPCKEEEEVKDDGTERGREGRKDEGIPDAPLLRRSQGTEWVYRRSKQRCSMDGSVGLSFEWIAMKSSTDIRGAQSLNHRLW